MQPLFTYSHTKPVVSTRFYYMPNHSFETKYIVSVGCDNQMILSSLDGEWRFLGYRI